MSKHATNPGSCRGRELATLRHMAQLTLQTERLRLVPLADEHLHFEIELDSDPEVMRYITGRALSPDEVQQAHRRRLAAADEVPGLGFWAGFAADEFVGWWILQPPNGPDQPTVAGEAAHRGHCFQRTPPQTGCPKADTTRPRAVPRRSTTDEIGAFDGTLIACHQRCAEALAALRADSPVDRNTSLAASAKRARGRARRPEYRRATRSESVPLRGRERDASTIVGAGNGCGRLIVGLLLEESGHDDRLDRLYQ